MGKTEVEEERERERNRQETYKRSRMWQLVDEEGEGEGEDQENRDDRAERGRSSSSEIEDNESSEEEKEKKSKKKKKSKHKKKKEKKSSKGAINQNQYGAYGIIKEEHFYSKQREFEKYMEEVKHMPSILGQSKREIMEWFRTYMEDYNTATMPHPKYYNLEAWEIKEYQTQQELDRKRKKKRRKYDEEYEYVSDGDEEGVGGGIFNDEQKLLEERRRKKEEEERKLFEETKAKMMGDRNKREEMRDQEILRNELQVAYRQGDYETVKRLEKRLAPNYDNRNDGGAVRRRSDDDRWG